MRDGSVSSEIIQALRRFGTATIYEAQGAKGALDSGMKPIHPDMRLVGPALTVDIRPGDNLMLHYALPKAKPGDVLVVDAKGFLEAGPWGDVLTEQAIKAGVAGLVINGAVRDATSITRMGFPVFCRGLSIKSTGKNQPGRVNVPVTIGDVLINPGDIVAGDQDGVVVICKGEIESTIEKSIDRDGTEDLFRKKIRNGATTAELLGLQDVFKSLNIR